MICLLLDRTKCSHTPCVLRATNVDVYTGFPFYSGFGILGVEKTQPKVDCTISVIMYNAFILTSCGLLYSPSLHASQRALDRPYLILRARRVGLHELSRKTDGIQD